MLYNERKLCLENLTMPIYEYHCEGCGKNFEEQQPMSFNPADTECPSCNAKKAVRQISAVASAIKGPTRKPRGSDIKAEQAMKKIEATTMRLPPPYGKRGDYEPTP
jgi:putative FmdB family regulatory protein